tara:strand:- start:1863 stop:1982 length:120 start_codon:yes stop_codon:yes gene_type:complete
MNWKDKLNETFDKLAIWLGLAPKPVPIPIRKKPENRRKR